MDLTRHPCFNPKAKGECARIHLPVAPKCNVLCNFCNRKYDCVNESRPGVTSAVLSPAQAEEYLAKVMERVPNITVVGIAGPGDPFANPKETLETMRRIRKRWPEMLLCLSSNGLEIGDYIEEIARIGVSHVTITVNAVDPKIASKVYSWARVGKVIHRGDAIGEVIVKAQTDAIKRLKELGVTVKVNSIFIPGVNDHHMEEIAQTMKSYGVDLFNCMGLIPNPDTKFEKVPAPSKADICIIRDTCETYLPQMRHCQRCRADAVGLLEKDQSMELSGLLGECSQMIVPADATRPNIAVASMEGMLVNQHLGEASRFLIYGQDADKVVLLEERDAPKPGGGGQRWYTLADTLKDCRAILVSGIGETPRAVLEEEGLTVVEMDGLIEQGLEAVYGSGDISQLAKRRRGVSGGCCKGGGGVGCG
ncbi:radical SAM protein [Desulfovibrio inopinatus]|uniref:radical SAM protein n=1 Tax=Desulfovibrio inopinatus TaxID=102109 RepID=UPI00040A2059|nr:radical SAM protein [Desulfovibrio inopinatus]